MSTLAISFWSAVGGGSFVLVLPARVWLIFRNSITAWLTKRLTAQLERDADHYRHELGRDLAAFQSQLDRDMESYKNELARTQNIESFRAGVRRAVAMLELRLTALHEVGYALMEIPSWVHANMAFAGNRPAVAVLQQKITDFLEPANRYGLYFPNDFLVAYRELASDMLALHPEWQRNVIIPPDGPRTTALILRSATLGSRVTELHKALPDELAAIIADNPQAANRQP
jgi:hypothetical protein